MIKIRKLKIHVFDHFDCKVVLDDELNILDTRNWSVALVMVWYFINPNYVLHLIYVLLYPDHYFFNSTSYSFFY